MKPIVILWDIMLDIFYHGEVQRLNPESSAPLLRVKSTEYKIGWAGNVANNIASLGTRTISIGCVGEDQYGSVLNDLLFDSGVQFYPLRVNQPTIVKARGIDHRVSYQQLFRFDIEEKIELSSELKLQVVQVIGQSGCEYLIISDYEKWIIDEELMMMVKDICKAKWIRIIVDAKPNNIWRFHSCHLIKPNFSEFKKMIRKEIVNEDTEIEHYGKLFAEAMNANILITRGNKGCSYITTAWEYHHLETDAQQVFDVTGAGDTLIAVTAYGLNSGMNIIEAIKLWNKAAGIIVGKSGTAVITAEELGIP